MKTLARLFSPLLLAVLILSPSFAATFIAGTIGSGTWTSDGNPYVILDNATLALDSSLVIEEGVLVQGDVECSITLNGAFTAIGSREKPIIFTSSDPEAAWGGLRIWDNPHESTISWAIVENAGTFDIQQHGGGISVRESSLTMDSTIVRYNHADYDGGGMLVYNSNVDIHDCSFYGNSSDRFGSAIDFAAGASGVFHHNVMYENYATSGGAIYFYAGTVEADHLTMVNNLAGWGPTDAHWNSSISIITNSILWNSLSDGTVSDGQISYCCVSDENAYGDHLVFSDPQFVNADENLYYLTEYSPCIDAGDPESEPDPDGSLPDLGAFVYGTGLHEGYGSASVPDLPANAGSSVAIPLFMDILPAEPVYSLEGHLQLPMPPLTEIERAGLVEGGPAEVAGWNLEWSLAGDTVSFTLSGDAPLPGTGPLFQLVCTIDPAASRGTWPVDILDLTANQGSTGMLISSGSVTIVDDLLGDVSLNGQVQEYDASLVMQWLSGMLVLSDDQLTLAEVAGDQQVDAYDASLILQHVSGGIDHFPIEMGIGASTGSGELQVESLPVEDGLAPATVSFLQASGIGSFSLGLLFDPTALQLVSVETEMTGAYIMKRETAVGATVSFASGAMLDGDTDPALTLHFRSLQPGIGTVQVSTLRLNNQTPQLNVAQFTVANTLSAQEDPLPGTFTLLATYPNPFNPEINVDLNVRKAGRASVRIFDSLGREVAVLLEGFVGAGEYRLSWNGAQFASGVYFIRAEAGSQHAMRKVTLLR